LKAALVHLVADAADVPAAGLTPRDVCDHLRTLGAEETLAERLGEFLEACDAGRFGASTHDAGQMIQPAETLLRQIIQSFNTQKRFR
jgi:hypothetical protein